MRDSRSRNGKDGCAGTSLGCPSDLAFVDLLAIHWRQSHEALTDGEGYRRQPSCDVSETSCHPGYVRGGTQRLDGERGCKSSE